MLKTEQEVTKYIKQKYKLPFMKVKILVKLYKTVEEIENFISTTKPGHFEFGMLDYKESEEIKKLRNKI